MRSLFRSVLALVALAAAGAAAQAQAQVLAFAPVAAVSAPWAEAVYATVPVPVALSTTTQVTVEDVEDESPGSDRFVAAPGGDVPTGLAAYGPFRVLDANRAALVDATDERSPRAFAAMLAAFPAIATLELVECPGTDDDRANLRLGRMIRARGLATHVPANGSVRSGAVELFLAGAHRRAEPGAEFAVHAWADEEGHEPRDFPESAPENRAYLEYYREMGMSPAQARAFYAMTNSVPNASARWLDAAEMARWVSFQ